MEKLTRLFWFFAAYFGYVRATILCNNYGQGRKIGSKVTFRILGRKAEYGNDLTGIIRHREYVIFPWTENRSWLVSRQMVRAMYYNCWPDLFGGAGQDGPLCLCDPRPGDAILFQFTDTSMAGVVYNGRRWVGLELPPEVDSFWLMPPSEASECWVECGAIFFRNRTQISVPLARIPGMTLTPEVVVDYFAGRLSLGEMLEIDRRGRQTEVRLKHQEKLQDALSRLEKVRDSINSRTNAEVVELVREARILLSQTIA